MLLCLNTSPPHSNHTVHNHQIPFQLQKLAYAIKNSPTIIQPEWKKTLAKLVALVKESLKPLSIRMMPHDIATRWNSTYEMLRFVYTYRKAINMLTDDRTLKLRDYELSDEDWSIVKQL